MKKIVKRIVTIISLFFLVFCANSFASKSKFNPVLNIVPSTTSVSLPAQGSATVNYTITNNANSVVNALTITPGYNMPASLLTASVSSNGCTGTLNRGSSCNFQVTLQGTGSSGSTTLMPKLCLFGGSLCSVPTAPNRTAVNVSDIPVITGLSPTTGSTAGGTTVVITAKDLLNVTSVTFAGSSATIVSSTSTTVTVTTPAHAAGLVDVVVTNQYGSGTSANAFTYGPPPTITTLSPPTGSTAGGTSVTINGTNFSDATSVTFGGTAATMGTNTATAVTATTSAHAAGTVDVTVTTPYGTATLSNSYTYLPSSLGAQCWGGNFQGQLGDGSTTSTNKPTTAVSVVTSGITTITGSFDYTCAVVNTGAKCWGYNGLGELGDGTNTNSLTPVDVYGLTSGVIDITAGGQGQTCALLSGGNMKCWGFNTVGQLGNGTTTNSNVPVSVVGLSSNVIAITEGDFYTCALLNTGTIQCWGANESGQLGNGTTTNSLAPVTVSGLSGVIAISGGSAHVCALLNTGAVKCWGLNTSGQLGNGTTTTSTTPVDVSGLSSGVSAVTAGDFHTCALMNTGGEKCWGNNFHGQLGNGTTAINSSVPIDVSGLSSGVRSIVNGNGSSCALLTSGVMKCWGYNAYGQLGVGTNNNTNTPTSIITTGLLGPILAIFNHNQPGVSNCVIYGSP
ncbi:MAG: hypothetical protein A3F13_03015 [Gammaproteobacteria bacterium RIFCSPHIGHO2_12_FULL_40_19]|nr:MAG: hypothetical protein A3F13_03015 [Gammaproteobacteria bacterium RIFCSPHIGHO2_12_FULL_40_19]